MSNSTKGASKLASVLQERMKKMVDRSQGIIIERGEIIHDNKVRLYSIPDAVLDPDDYSVCATVYKVSPLKEGETVLIVWTHDGEPIVLDRIVEADKLSSYLTKEV